MRPEGRSAEVSVGTAIEPAGRCSSTFRLMPQARRRALNEAVFRDVNELIKKASANRHREQLEIVCECFTMGCSVPLQLSVAEYEEARADATVFIVAPGHVDPDIEVVVQDHGRYMLVQKIGSAAEQARETDPRA